MPRVLKDIPQYHALFNPTLDALRSLGGSGTIEEIGDRVIDQIGLPEALAEEPHGESNQTEIGYRLAWARTYLKKVGLLENSEWGVWALTEDGRKADQVDPMTIKRKVRAMAPPRTREGGLQQGGDEGDPDSEMESWQDLVLSSLKAMNAEAFERLCQRLLRESGFIEVEVTARGGDGGIDGRGVLRLNGLISFTVLFQSKRWKDAVGAPVVRDFRGALMGRADKGLIITTGRFTQDAQREATRDGATPIDLIDGDLLVAKLKELKLGITTRIVEEVVVDPTWFENL